MSEVEMIETSINGRWSLKLPAHRAARPEWQTGWEPERLAWMHHVIQPGDTVYDVGTEEGDMSALLAQWCKHAPLGMRGGSILLFEPNQRVWPNVKAIFEANGLHPPAVAWTGFLGPENREGVADDWRMAEDGMVFDGWPKCADGPLIGDHGFLNLSERPDVPVATIDWIAELEPEFSFPSVITIDVEGAELEVLRGADRTLSGDTIWGKPIVFVSVHPEFSVEMYGHTPVDLHRYMGEHGYTPIWLASDHEEHFVYVDLTQRDHREAIDLSEGRLL